RPGSDHVRAAIRVGAGEPERARPVFQQSTGRIKFRYRLAQEALRFSWLIVSRGHRDVQGGGVEKGNLRTNSGRRIIAGINNKTAVIKKADESGLHGRVAVQCERRATQQCRVLEKLVSIG